MTTPGPFFKYNVFFLHMFGQYRPEPHWPKVLKVIYYSLKVITYTCFATTLIFSFMGILIYGFNQISDVAISIVNIFVYASITIKSLHFLYNNKLVEYLIYRLETIFKESGSLAFEPFTMKQGRFASNLVLFSWMFFAWGAGLFMAMPAYFKANRELPLPLWLFYDWTDDKYFLPTLTFQTVGQIFMVSYFANVEMFNACPTILLTHQFRLLADDFNNVFTNALHKCGMPRNLIEQYMAEKENKILEKIVQEISSTKEFQKAAEENLVMCIEHHQELLTFRDEFYDFISPQLMTELNFLFAYLIFTLFTFITTDNKAIYLALSQYFGGTIAQIFMMCYFGEQLTNQVEDLMFVLYDMPWHYCDQRFMKNFKLVQLRMSKNDYLKAGKLLPISLETFLEFMKKAASFFAVLRQVN